MTVRAVRGLWRWRRNALRRTTDRIEAGVALVALALIVFAAPALGWLVGSAAQGALQDMAREQRAARHLVPATVVRVLNGPRLDTDPETAPMEGARRRVLANWTAPDGSRHQGAVSARPSVGPGERFRFWVDDHGSPAKRPMDAATADTHAVLAGVGAAAGAALLVEGGRRLVVWQLMRRRYARWDTAWERARQDWGRMGTGS